MASAALIQAGIERRDQIVAFVAGYHERRGFAPTLAEVAEAVDISSSAARGHLHKLADEGRVRVTPGVSRSIVVVDA